MSAKSSQVFEDLKTSLPQVLTNASSRHQHQQLTRKSSVNSAQKTEKNMLKQKALMMMLMLQW